MPPQRRGRIYDTGILLLLYEVIRIGVGNVPPVTLSFIIGQMLLYLGFMDVPWSKEDVCISTYTMLRTRDWKRFVISAFEHGDDMHLYYNMVSFLLKGRSLEKKFGSKNFFFLLGFILVLTNSIYVGLGYSFSEFSGDASYSKACAIGFSGVIFALKVLTTCENPSERAQIFGVRMPGKYAAWVELILIHLLVPNSSFTGHLAGILAGLVYCNTCVGTIIDYIISAISGKPMLHGLITFEDYEDYTYNEPYANYEENDRSSQSYGWNRTLYGGYDVNYDDYRNGYTYRR